MTDYTTGTMGGGATSVGADRPSVQHAANAESPGSLGQLFGEVTKDLSTLVRQEIALAKAEAKQEVSTVGKGAGMLGGAGYAGHLAILFLSVTVWAALSNVMDEAWAALIVFAFWAIVAGVLALMGKAQLKKAKGLPQTQATVKEIPPTLKPSSH